MSPVSLGCVLKLSNTKPTLTLFPDIYEGEMISNGDI